MNKKAIDVFEAALALSDDERDELLRLLTARADDSDLPEDESYDGFASPEIRQAWLDECYRRDALIDSGEEQAIPADEVMRDIRKFLAENFGK